MRVKEKKTGVLGWSSKFNPLGLGEIIVTFDEGDATSDYISNYDVMLSDERWVDLHEALKLKLVMTDDSALNFAEATDLDRKRGYIL